MLAHHTLVARVQGEIVGRLITRGVQVVLGQPKPVVLLEVLLRHVTLVT